MFNSTWVNLKPLWYQHVCWIMLFLLFQIYFCNTTNGNIFFYLNQLGCLTLYFSFFYFFFFVSSYLLDVFLLLLLLLTASAAFFLPWQHFCYCCLVLGLLFVVSLPTTFINMFGGKETTTATTKNVRLNSLLLAKESTWPNWSVGWLVVWDVFKWLYWRVGCWE